MMTGPVRCPACGNQVGTAMVEDGNDHVLLDPYPSTRGRYVIVGWAADNRFTVRKLGGEEYVSPAAMLWIEHDCSGLPRAAVTGDQEATP